MFPTLEEILQLDALKTCRVIAGKSGLTNSVRYVDTMEIPDIKPWLKANELLVTTAYVIRDDTEALESLVRNLVQARSAGLMLKTARFLGVIPPSVVELADKMGFPIVEVPKEVPFIDIISAIMQEIIGRQTRYLEHSSEVWRVLTSLKLRGAGLPAIASTLAVLVGNEVVVLGPQMEPLAWGEPDTPGSPLAPENVTGTDPDRRQPHAPGWLSLLADYKSQMTDLASTVRIPLGGDQRWCRVRPVIVRGETVSYVVVSEAARRLGDMDLVALEHTATSVALEIIKEQTVDSAAKNMELDFFDDLLSDNIANEQAATRRFHALGYPRHGFMVVILLRADETGSPSFSVGEAVKQAMDRLPRTAPSPSRIPMVPRGNRAMILYPVSSKRTAARESQEAARFLQREVSRKVRTPVSAGISGVFAELTQTAKRYQEAVQALRITRLVAGEGTIGNAEDLIPYRLLLEQLSQPSLREMYVSLVGPLLEHDADKGTNLAEVLQVALMEPSKQIAATKLHIHRNTLLARLREIEETLGVDLDKPEDAFRLSLGVRVGLLLRELPQ